MPTPTPNYDNMFDPSICPSSLDEHGHPATEGETAHKWDEGTCAECGTTRPLIKCVCTACGNEHERYDD